MKRFLLSDRVSIRAVLPQQHKGEAAQHSPEVLSYGLPQEGVKSVNLLSRVQSSFRAAVWGSDGRCMGVALQVPHIGCSHQ